MRRRELVIDVTGLHKRYGDIEAVRGIDLQVERGEIYALLGPNGAGKTTTVEILEGYRQRDAGTVSVLGEDPTRATHDWRARIGIVLQSTGAFEELTVTEIVTHFASFFPNPLDPAEVIERVGLAGQRDQRGGKLSGGQKRRLDIALGIVGRPELVFLDEPTTGLDPQARRRTWGVIQQLTDGGATVLLTTHYLDEAEALADRVAVIVAGRIVAAGPPRELGGRAKATARVTFLARGPLADRALPRLAGATIEARDGHIDVHTDRPTAAVITLSRWAARAGAPELPELVVSRPTLEDVYLRLVAEHGEQEGAR